MKEGAHAQGLCVLVVYDVSLDGAHDVFGRQDPRRLSHTCEILAVDRQPNAPKLFSAERPKNVSGSLTDRYGFSSRLCRPAP